MKHNIHDESVKDLFIALLSLKTVDECYALLEDLCTPNELLSIAQRFQVGEMLKENRTYKEISKVTGASTTTISRVNRLLNDDKHGIEMAYERIRGKKYE
jgi:TrpR-related protein YerC/YecD